MDTIRMMFLKLAISNGLSIPVSLLLFERRLRRMRRVEFTKQWQEYTEAIYEILRPYIYPQLLRYAIVWNEELWNVEWRSAFDRIWRIVNDPKNERFLSSSQISYLVDMEKRRDELNDIDKAMFQEFCTQVLRGYAAMRKEIEETQRRLSGTRKLGYYWREYRKLSLDESIPERTKRSLFRLVLSECIDLYVNLPLGIATLAYIGWNVYLIVR